MLRLVHDTAKIAEPAKQERRGPLGQMAETTVVAILSAALWSLWIVGLVRLWPGVKLM